MRIAQTPRTKFVVAAVGVLPVINHWLVMGLRRRSACTRIRSSRTNMQPKFDVVGESQPSAVTFRIMPAQSVRIMTVDRSLLPETSRPASGGPHWRTTVGPCQIALSGSPQPAEPVLSCPSNHPNRRFLAAAGLPFLLYPVCLTKIETDTRLTVRAAETLPPFPLVWFVDSISVQAGRYALVVSGRSDC